MSIKRTKNKKMSLEVKHKYLCIPNFKKMKETVNEISQNKKIKICKMQEIVYEA